MNGNEDGVVFSFNVAKDNPIMIDSKKKSKVLNGVLCLLATIFFVSFLILSQTSNNPSMAVAGVFGCFAAFALICTIYFFATMNGTAKDKNKSLEFILAEEMFVVVENDNVKKTKRYLSKCLYSKYANKQYIAKVIESSDRFDIKIYTGSYNLIPQYKKCTLPKNVIGDERLETFREFFKQKVGTNYITK